MFTGINVINSGGKYIMQIDNMQIDSNKIICARMIAAKWEPGLVAQLFEQIFNYVHINVHVYLQ